MKKSVVDIVIGGIIKSLILIVIMIIIVIICICFNIIPNPFSEDIEIISSDLESVASNIEEIKIDDIQHNEITENKVVEEIEYVVTNNSIPSKNPETYVGSSSGYYYKQLNSQAKQIYDKIKNNENILLSGTDTLKLGNMFSSDLQNDGGVEKVMDYINDAITALYYDKQDLFYVDFTKIEIKILKITQGRNVSHSIELKLAPTATSYWIEGITSKEQAVNYKNNLKTKAEEITQNVKNANEYDKIKYIHDWLVNNVEYDKNNINCHTSYGAIIEKKAVCDGYARAFKYMLDQLGINSIVVTGTGTNTSGETESHAWNYVQINNGRWYAVDVTWDDPIIVGGGLLPEKHKYNYFLKGMKFKESHVEIPVLFANGSKFIMPLIEANDY